MGSENIKAGSEGYLYYGTLSSADSTGGNAVNNWYKITAIAGTSSALPANLVVGDVFYSVNGAMTTGSLTSADRVKQVTLTKVGFCMDVSKSGSREKYECTVQTDSVRAYKVSAKSEITGTVNGYVHNDDSVQRTLMANLEPVLEQSTDGTITKNAVATDTLHFFMSRDESTASDKQVWDYMPMIIDGLTMDKPMDDVQTFNFNYTEDGSEKPAIIVIDN